MTLLLSKRYTAFSHIPRMVQNNLLMLPNEKNFNALENNFFWNESQDPSLQLKNI